MKGLRQFFNKLTILAELIGFFWQQKLWWLIPFIIVLLIVGMLIVTHQTITVAPFVYPIF